MVEILGPSPQFITSPDSAETQPLVCPTSPEPAVVRSARIIELPVDVIRLQRVTKLAQACGDQSPDLKARPAKQKERRVADLPNVVEIEYLSGRKVWFLRYFDPLTRSRTSIKLGVVGVMPFIEMAALAKRWQDDIAEGRSPKASKMTVDFFVQGDFARWAEANLRSFKGFLSKYWRRISPQIGHMALGAVKPRDGQRLITALRQGNPQLKNATINRDLMAVRTVFRIAVEFGHLSGNPMRDIRQFKETPPSPRALEPDQLARFFTALAGESEKFILLIKLALATAARIDEILELRYSDIDRAADVLHLRMTKAGEAQTLPLTSYVDAILIQLERFRRPGNDYILPGRTVGHMAAPYKTLHRVLANAGLETAGFHLFRKTFATQAMTQIPGMDVLTVAKLLRHKSVRTLEVHYLATSQKRLHQAANDIGKLLQVSPQLSLRIYLKPSVRSVVIDARIHLVAA